VSGTPSADLIPSVREWFATPGPLTSLGPETVSLPRHADPRATVATAVEIVQGLLVYDLFSQHFYGVPLRPERAEDVHVRAVDELLARARALDPRPLHVARPPERRVTGRCRTFAALTVAVLRANGIPARARCGFGAYFRPGYFEDHWVAEYRHDVEQRWVMVDAQLDDAWVAGIGFDGDPLDVTADEFVTAGRAWTAWREGRADASRYGLSAVQEHGAFWIAGNLRLDVAALNKVEMLPWDVWGAAFGPDDPIPDDLGPFDTLATISRDPDAELAALRARYDTDPRVRMPGTVTNVLRGCEETVAV
jgi:hypothetical protein